MKTKLVEFKNNNGDILRGIAAIPEVVTGRGAVFLQGLERNATVEKKFRRLADALAARGIISLRFDASGCGLSDGDFAKTTLRGRSNELMAAVNYFQKDFGKMKISFVAHSLGMCALALKLDGLEDIIERMVFISPALNQSDLMRYYYVRDMMGTKEPGIIIGWDNYKKYLNEEEFTKDCSRTGRIMRENYIEPGYLLEAKDIDLSNYFDKIREKILHVHGEHDIKVPLGSLNTKFPNRIIVSGGDHDLERPDLFNQWFPQSVDFLAR